MKILKLDYQPKDEMLFALKKALKNGYTHFIPSDLNIDIYPDQLDALTPIETKQSVIVDYTIDHYYQNDCRYFGNHSLTFDEWMNNINHYPNMIFNIKQSIQRLKAEGLETAFDLAVSILLFNKVEVNGHVVFDFKESCRTSASFYTLLKEKEFSGLTQFNLNKLAYLHYHKRPFKLNTCELPDHPRFIDKMLWNTRFTAPHFVTSALLDRSYTKHQNASNIYEPTSTDLNGAVVFLGFDYSFRGNSRYLFNYFAKHHSQYPVYFITSEATGPHFIQPDDPEAEDLINQASVIVAESYIPDHLKPNGTIIQLWHGTPIKQLFLDSKEPYQNQEIYNYRARKYNKWTHQNYLICDSIRAAELFKTAFPMQYSEIAACGYPRVRYLIDKKNDRPYVRFIKNELQLNPDKPTLLYAPTWHHESHQEDLLPMTEQLLAHYNVIYKGHIEEEHNMAEYLPKEVIIPTAHLETQDLILASDVVLSDYSSIVFDALTINMPTALYTPDVATYEKERGLYPEVWQTFERVRYENAEPLIEDLIHQRIKPIGNPYINRNNHSVETISSLIVQNLPASTRKRKSTK
ncbi:CDP-glycerol glycerophosphotransferase family protein [Staphylococcus debuckii]|uniref:CDP-glycerol glycerophosphotransferase family protein n=1 Tax=Staphylococcus debuckii TaxID=2044912 RepID=UPI000F42D621|nr:CDP-glycerol glycerophosphotransferase family protein [Staphylococcus debuckii]AYU55987.1 teichoic acid biosynthesis protein F [Staphylococcus debuckii]